MTGHRSAFSLIELLIVVAIVAILTGVGYSYYQDSLQESRETVVRHNLKTVRQAISMYFKDHMAYPKQLESLIGPYLKEGIPELLIYPLRASASVFVEVPTPNSTPEAFQATKTEWIYYPFDGSNIKEIKDVKIKLNNMTIR